MAEPFFITTAIPYVNARPHIGFALEIVLADTIARAHRDAGFDVRFQTGTDDNGLKNVRAAEEAGLPVEAFVERNARAFAALTGALDLSVDDFISTSSDPRHARGAQALWRAAAGDIDQREYTGRYCIGCESFIDQRCDEHDQEPELVAERNYFFALHGYQGWLHGAISSGQIEIVPQARRNEVLRVIEGGLTDFSISRSVDRARGWGVPVPGDASQVQYVWFDALANYITALGYPEPTDELARWWSPGGRRVHVIGKNITRFHAIYWPAILRAAALPLPTTILVHGFVTEGGAKVSKSRGGGLDPVSLAARHGADVVRYALLRQDPSDDFDLTEDKIERVGRAELSDQLGNLVSRVLALIESRLGGRPPALTDPAAIDRSLLVHAATAEHAAARAGLDLCPDRAVAAIRDLIADANKAIVAVKPWTLDPGDHAFGSHLATQLQVLEVVARAYRPIVPRAAAQIACRIAAESIAGGAPLFPRARAG